jgi:hypothetical protein
MTMRTMIASMGLRSIIPVLGMTLRRGSMIGSVTRWRSWKSGLDWSIGNQLRSERAMIAQVRISRNASVNWATYGSMTVLRVALPTV